MKIKEGYILREVAGNNIVVPVGTERISFNGLMTLNEVGSFIWRILENGADRDEIVAKVTESYAVDGETAGRDIDIYIAKLREKNLIED